MRDRRGGTTSWAPHERFAFNTATGAILLKTPLPAGSYAPVCIDGDDVIVSAGWALSKAQQPLIIAYKPGATGQLPDTVR
jgi:hypothetical protein